MAKIVRWKEGLAMMVTLNSLTERRDPETHPRRYISQMAQIALGRINPSSPREKPLESPNNFKKILKRHT